jgi:ornithine cyclodeaminase
MTIQPKDLPAVCFIDGEEVARSTPFPALIERLRQGFADYAHAPERYHLDIPHQDGSNTLLLMPNWAGGFQGLKVTTVAPSNVQLGLPSIASTYLLNDRRTGALLGLLDGNVLTSRRTAAASALAASYLAKPKSTSMLLLGTGKIASLIPDAYRAVLPIKTIKVFSKTAERAEALAKNLSASGFEASMCKDLARDAKTADVISCSTLANEIVLRGAWLGEGQFVDLIGSFKPQSREADDDVFKGAHVAVDTEVAYKESGDLLQPIKNDVLKKENHSTTLISLCSGKSAGRRNDRERWIFKSVGTALEDIVAATLAYERHK